MIANKLGKRRISVIILEAGAGIPPNINEYMTRFYSATAKVPESPYTPTIFATNPNGGLSDPNKVNAGRPTVLSLGPKAIWRLDRRETGLFDSEGPTTIRKHLRSRRRRHVALARHLPAVCAERFQDEVAVRQSDPLVDWPIEYKDLDSTGTTKPREELGVSADVDEQTYCGIEFPPGHHIRCRKFQIRPRTSTSTSP